MPRYISINDKASIKIQYGRWYVISDYRGKELPLPVRPLRKSKGYYVSETKQGGYVHIKPAEFLREERKKPCSTERQ